MKICFATLFLLFFSIPVFPQFRTNAQKLVLSNEDSLNSGINKNTTVISGYGNALYQRDFHQQYSRASLERVVLFVAHQFSPKISVFTELEVENALVAGAGSDEATGWWRSVDGAGLSQVQPQSTYVSRGWFVCSVYRYLK